MENPVDFYKALTRRGAPAGAEGPATPTVRDSIVRGTTLGSDLRDLKLRGVSPEQPFRLRSIAARGGVGEVWEAEQPSLRRTIAVKRLRQRLYEKLRDRPSEVELREQEFQLEALITAQLDHPNIVPVYDLNFAGEGEPQIAMKLVRGRNWEGVISGDLRTMEPLDYLRRHLAILRSVAQAIAFAHGRGIVHRDLKPAQVMIGEFGEVLLMDWGLAVYVGPDDDTDSLIPPDVAALLPRPRTAASPAGTPCMMAPEQTRNSASMVGETTDIFLLGATLYWILTGVPPHEGDELTNVLNRAAECDIIPPGRRVPDRLVPDELDALAMQCMAKQPGWRPRSALEFIARLDAFMDGITNRSESEALASHVREQLRTLDSTTTAAPGQYEDPAQLYEALTDGLSNLERAKRLWSANPHVTELRERILSLYAEAAIRQGDLTLARAMARQLEDDQERARLFELTETEERRLRAHARQRVLGLAAAAVLAVAVIGGMTFYTAGERTARREAELARAGAVDMMSFMLRSLHSDLEDVGQLPLLERVADQAIRWYESTPADARGEDLTAQYALALRQRGRARLGQGRFDEAIADLNSAHDVRHDLEGGDHSEAGFEHAMDKYHIGVALKRNGDLDAASGHLQEALTMFERLRTSDPDDAEITRALTDALGQLGNIRFAHSTNEEARALFERQLALRRALMDRSPDDPQAIGRVATSHIQIAWTHRADLEPEQRLDHLRKAIALQRRAADLAPESNAIASALGQGLSELGWALNNTGRAAEALGPLREAVTIREHLFRIDPANTEWAVFLSDAQIRLARALQESGAPPEQVATARIAMRALIDQQYSRAPNDPRWMTRRALMLKQDARAAVATNAPAALAAAEEAERLHRHMLEADPKNLIHQAEHEDSVAFLREIRAHSAETRAAGSDALYGPPPPSGF